MAITGIITGYIYAMSVIYILIHEGGHCSVTRQCVMIGWLPWYIGNTSSLHQWLKRSSSSGSYCGSVHIYRRTSARKADMPAPAPSLFALFYWIFQICTNKMLPVKTTMAVDTNQQSESGCITPSLLFCLCLSQDILLSSLGREGGHSNHGVTWTSGGRRGGAPLHCLLPYLQCTY